MRVTTFFAFCPRLPRLLLPVLLLVLGACQSAPPPTAVPARQPATSTAGKTGEGGQCYQGCIRWGEACNADPRGVYKCQRRCEQFGEVCE